jgi:hypothetical protein
MWVVILRSIVGGYHVLTQHFASTSWVESGEDADRLYEYMNVAKKMVTQIHGAGRGDQNSVWASSPVYIYGAVLCACMHVVIGSCYLTGLHHFYAVVVCTYIHTW